MYLHDPVVVGAGIGHVSVITEDIYFNPLPNDKILDLSQWKANFFGDVKTWICLVKG